MNKSKAVIVKEVYAFLKENHPMFNKEIRKKFSEKNKDVDKKISIHKIEQFILDNNWNDMNDNQFEYNLRCFLALLKDAHTMIGFIKTTPVECYLWRNGKNAYNNQFLYKNDEVFIKVNGQYEKVLQICG